MTRSQRIAGQPADPAALRRGRGRTAPLRIGRRLQNGLSTSRSGAPGCSVAVGSAPARVARAASSRSARLATGRFSVALEVAQAQAEADGGQQQGGGGGGEGRGEPPAPAPVGRAQPRLQVAPTGPRREVRRRRWCVLAVVRPPPRRPPAPPARGARAPRRGRDRSAPHPLFGLRRQAAGEVVEQLFGFRFGGDAGPRSRLVRPARPPGPRGRSGFVAIAVQTSTSPRANRLSFCCSFLRARKRWAFTVSIESFITTAISW